MFILREAKNHCIPKSGGKTIRANLYKTQLLHGCNDRMAAYKHDFSIPGVRVDYSATPNTRYLSRMFTSTELKGMLEEKDYSNVGLVFSFVEAFLDRVLRDGDNSQLSTAHTLYSHIVDILMNNTTD